MTGKAAWALVWSLWCVLAAAVPLGISLLSLRLEQYAWRANEHGLTLVLVFAGLMFYLAMAMVYLFVRDCWMEDQTGTARWVVFWAGVVVVVACSFTAGVLGDREVEQRILHDRGVTSTGVVTGIKTSTSDSGAPEQVGVYVRLNDGRSFSVDGEPRVGSTVQVTTDPQDKVRPQLGPRPAAPAEQVLKALLAVLAVGHLMAASITCGPLSGTARSRRRHPAGGRVGEPSPQP
ncbi:hypothetical protein [Actinoallomurus soli]|uniref:hypothetical protein n=1 Tax=Actinoallomurus soli TaxID=2952535 RepID=UPI002092F7B2|nr:hypothetical protein [Actinoallomurus soli]MCO5967921.1 hypothetical protein [Actinoallomurus soli]